MPLSLLGIDSQNNRCSLFDDQVRLGEIELGLMRFSEGIHDRHRIMDDYQIVKTWGHHRRWLKAHGQKYGRLDIKSRAKYRVIVRQITLYL